MRRIRGGQLAKAMLFGGIATFLGVAINAALDYARQDWTNPVGIAVVAVLASASGVIPLLQSDRVEPRPGPRSEPYQPPGRGPAVGHAQVPPAGQVPGYGQPPPSQYDWQAPYGPPRPEQPARPKAARVSLLAAGLVLLVLCGGGAAGVTYGVKFFGGWITGDEKGSDILAGAARTTAGPLTLTVEKFEQTRNFTRLWISATNSGDDIPKLVVSYAQLTGGRVTLKADPFRSDWPEDVPSGPEGVAGWLVFPRHLPAGTTTASLTFTTIFGTLRGPHSITVSDIRLTPPR